MTELEIELYNLETLHAIFGDFDANVAIIQKQYGVSIFCRDEKIKIIGQEDRAECARRVVMGLLELLEKGEAITEQSVRYVISLVNEGMESQVAELGGDTICVTFTGKPVKTKTIGQKHYCDKIKANTIVFGVGPAGTGKTYLAVAQAVRAFKNHEINRIILTRPAVEAGEKLGFLPGDLQNKVDPYLRPLYDALFDMMGAESYQRNLERGVIEVAPLAYMRGRTLDDSFIILDEAQNTTPEQMKMFLTRLGFNSKMVITGDITQIDLPDSKRSGLVEAIRVLKNIEDIGIVRFSEKDVVRHKLVQDIVKAYDRFYGNRKNER
ncbi:MAG: PhoH family protein [Bacteroides sp.]|nr:PhoH family protein [Eubacterium sp.]MCM1417924.1 PhoH family protein [Roseburia sp.]MCM1461913.1 PhoH family protein [Bacteroides sp.]